MTERAVSHLLAGLNAAQQEAVLSEAQPLCILAGAGSGKTRVLTRRIAYRAAVGTADPQHVLAVTFTRRAAGELRTRLGRLGLRDPVAAGTFHGLALTVLRRWWTEREQPPRAILDRKVRLLAALLPAESRALAGEVAAEIEWAKARLVEPGQYAEMASAAGRRPPLTPSATASVFGRYEQEKDRRRLVDFDDLLRLCASALEQDRAFAAAQRWRFRHLFVDEFQDVNPLQLRLLEAWRGDRLDLCVVGDPNQAIYAWNGADPAALTGFADRFPQAARVHLDENHRSSPQILAVANAVLESRPEGLSRPLRATQGEGPVPTVTSYPTDGDEAREIARAVRRRGAGGWSSMAVLTRTHAQLLLLERELQALAVPYRLRGAAPFMQRPEVKLLVAQLASSPATPLRSAVADLRHGQAQATEDDQEASDDPSSRLGFVRLAEEHLAAEPTATSEGFVAWLTTALRGNDDDAFPSAGAVELATFHAAKGLEWPVVFLAGLEQGLVPIGHADTPAAKAEERRLLYVAATRARRELHCSWAERRTFGSRTSGRSPSPYLEPVTAAVRDLGSGGSGANWQRFLDDSRSQLRPQDRWSSYPAARPLPLPDPEVLDALRSWRATTARASGVPAFVVLHDTTLAAMAEAKPRSRAALLALPGVGPVKAERYGEALLAVVATAAAS